MKSVRRFGLSSEKRLAESEIVDVIPLHSSRPKRHSKIAAEDRHSAVGSADRTIHIGRENVGRIAERIVANELEARGFAVSHLNRDGLAPNADLAISPSLTLQVQVKGATNGPKDRLWIGYGNFTKEMVEGKRHIFSGRQGFYEADTVILVAVRAPTKYTCFVLPVDIAEQAAQLHCDTFRVRGWPQGRTHLVIEPGRHVEKNDPRVAKCRAIVIEELAILDRYRDERGWANLAPTGKANAK